MRKSLFFVFSFVLIPVFFPLYGEKTLIREGLSYERIGEEDRRSIHILEVDPSRLEIVPVRALDDGIGRETVSSLCVRHGAVAAVNGGFFRIRGTLEGLPAGILKIGNDWFSLGSKPRGAVGWSRGSGPVLFDRILARCSLRVEGKVVPLDGLNRARQEGEKILFLPSFHRTTLTDPGGTEWIVRNQKMEQSIPFKGSNKIPEGGFVVSAAPGVDASFFGLPPGEGPLGKRCDFLIETVPQTEPACTLSRDWDLVDHIVGGAPLLIRGGKRIVDFSAEKTIETFLTDRHGRTAVGVLKSGHWVFVVVEGRKPEKDKGGGEGMTMEELSLFMEKLGCVDALNLDGGGSSAVAINGCLVNKPRGDSDESPDISTERKVSDAFLILERTKGCK